MLSQKWLDTNFSCCLMVANGLSNCLTLKYGPASLQMFTVYCLFQLLINQECLNVQALLFCPPALVACAMRMAVQVFRS